MIRYCYAVVICCCAGCGCNDPVRVTGTIVSAESALESSIGPEWAIIDERWNRLGGAKISVLALDTNRTVLVSTTSDEKGQYFFQLPAQEAIIRVEKEGFEKIEQQFTVGTFSHFQRNTVVLKPLKRA